MFRLDENDLQIEKNIYNRNLNEDYYYQEQMEMLLNESVREGKRHLKQLSLNSEGDSQKHESHDAYYFYDKGKYYKQMKSDPKGTNIKRAKRSELKTIGLNRIIDKRQKEIERRMEKLKDKKKEKELDMMA